MSSGNNCLLCGDEFFPLHNEKFCRNCISKISTKCPQCGKLFYPKTGARERKFCSPECKIKYYNNARPHAQPSEKICATCGKKFTSKTAGKKYCSRECYPSHIHHKDYYSPVAPKITCPICGKDFQATYHRKYCSDECAKAANSQKAAEKYQAQKAQNIKIKKVKPVKVEKVKPVEVKLAKLEDFKPEPVKSGSCIPAQITMLKCPQCGKEFQKLHNCQKYCSPECAKKADRQKNLERYHAKKVEKVKPVKRGSCIPAQITMLKCPHCGKEFQKLHNCQKYCSAACRDAVHQYQPVKKYVKKCANCGKEFKAVQPNQKYCSELCRRLGNGLYKPDLKKCSHCGKTFQPKRKDQPYCSDECRIAARDEKVKQLMARDHRHESKMDRYIRESAECGMSYGKYRQAVELQGRTYAELRAEHLKNINAANNAPPAFIYGGI